MPGRRRYDYDLHLALSKKLLALMILVINAACVAGNTYLFGLDKCQ